MFQCCLLLRTGILSRCLTTRCISSMSHTDPDDRTFDDEEKVIQLRSKSNRFRVKRPRQYDKTLNEFDVNNVIGVASEGSEQYDPFMNPEWVYDEYYKNQDNVSVQYDQQTYEDYNSAQPPRRIPTLSEAPPLGIFSSQVMAEISDTKLEHSSPVWKAFYEMEMEQLMQKSQPPRSWFDHCARMTKQGRLWEFPINNEQDLDAEEEAESRVPFEEHSLIQPPEDNHPAIQNPIVQEFFELATVGLSKNHTLTAAEKQEHLRWFVKYFKDNQYLLDRKPITHQIHANARDESKK
ncbi:hypothetical protein ACOME3_008422 [Neoechinorhynchus agilis]